MKRILLVVVVLLVSYNRLPTEEEAFVENIKDIYEVEYDKVYSSGFVDCLDNNWDYANIISERYFNETSIRDEHLKLISS